ncbi:MAG TPA: hypothetical protein VND91_13050 [Candidatus Saccharimonadia bacterium]|nr:hypothetical protein [Candidatus Saccharimonadia bacterium]
MNTQFSSETIRAYLDRHLDARTEQALEEALIMDAELADEVQAEAALRRGFAELKRRETETQPRSNVHSIGDAAARRTAPVVARPRQRYVRYAAAAALFGLAAIPSYLALQNMRQQADFEARLTARIESSGDRAAYQLPASLSTEAPAAASDSPLRLRLPENVREVSLELPSTDSRAPTRLQLEPASQPGAQITLAGVPLSDDNAIGFRVGSERLLPGSYKVTVERQQDGGWVADREFVLNIDAAQR